MVRRAGRDRVRLSATLLDRARAPPPSSAGSPMSKPAAIEPYVGAHDPREQDVADLVVDGVGPVDPVLLHEDAASPSRRRPPRPGACGSTARRRSRRACRSPARARPRRGTPACAPCCRRRRGRSCSPRAWPRSRPCRRDARSAARAMHRRRPEDKRYPLEIVEAHLDEELLVFSGLGRNRVLGVRVRVCRRSSAACLRSSFFSCFRARFSLTACSRIILAIVVCLFELAMHALSFS